MSFRQKVGLNEMRRLTDDFQWGVSLRHVHVRPTMAFFKQTKFIKTLKTCGKFYKAAPNGKRKEKTKTHTK